MTVMLIVLLAIALLAIKFVWNAFCSPLNDFQGPFLARFTDLWRLLDTRKGRCDVTQNRLHRQYGLAVRLGPNVISLSDPAMIKTVFSHKPVWKKSAMYNVNDALVGRVRVPNLNSMTDEVMHDATIKPIRSFYSMSNVRKFETLLDPTIKKWCKALESRFADRRGGQSFDAGAWVNYFAWDAMSEMTFSKPFGFIDEGRDVGGFLAQSEYGLKYFAIICQMPWLDYIFDKNPIRRIGAPSFSWAVEFGMKCLMDRHILNKDLSSKGCSKTTTDFLDKFLEAQTLDPSAIPDSLVVNFLLINVLAGSDTTAITIVAAIYHILRAPSVYRKLVHELRAKELSSPVVSWADILALPYLNAVMQEVMRVHSGVGLMIERIVPGEGATLPDGRHIPAGTIVGMNPWVVHRSSAYFGPEDPDAFVPERWLCGVGESKEAFATREQRMKEATLTFGHGPRICLGRNLSRLEAYKLIATLFRNYDLELAEPDKEWEIKNWWFVYQKGIDVRIRKA